VRVLRRYLNRMFMVRFGVVLFGIIGFATVVDLLDVAEDLAQAASGVTRATLTSVGLRLPIMLSELMSIAAMIAGLLTVADLMRHRELVVIWSSGVRPLTLLRLLLPAGLLLVGIKFAVDDVALPRAAASLRAWGIGEYRPRPTEGEAAGFAWLRDGGDIVRLASDALGAGRLEQVTVFRRDPNGILTARIDAARAEPVPGGWRLEDVTRLQVSPRAVERLPALELPIDIDLEQVRLMIRPPRELPLVNLAEIAAAGGYGLKALEPYRTWLHQRVAGAWIPMLLMMLAFALVRRFSRTASIAPVFLTAVAIGFSFLIASGVSSALGEVGLVAPALAAWTPTAALAALVLAIGSFEGGRVR
jgi:lipopolysaccharide export system permease protein